MPERKLLAIMFTDVVGFSTSMSRDELAGIEILQKNRAILKPSVEKFHGVFLKEIGDGTLSSFPSAVEAVLCALEIQEAIKKEKNFSIRIGIHLGDVIIDSNDVFGDGVNIASRIEPQAKPGCVCVSKEVYEQIKNKTFILAEPLGEKELKGIAGKVDLYSIARDSKSAEYEKFKEEIISDKTEKKRSRPNLRKGWLAALAIAIGLVVVGLGLYFAIENYQRRTSSILTKPVEGSTQSTVLAYLKKNGSSYKPKNGEELDGVWINDKLEFQEQLFSRGSWKEYLKVSDKQPSYVGSYGIVSKWTDTYDNIYYRVIVAYSDYIMGSGNVRIRTYLIKLNETSTEMESIMRIPTSDEELAMLPWASKIALNDYYYRIYYRANK
jgi:class 3 adenylate cyclase